MPAGAVAASFQHIEETDEISFDIGMGIGQRVTDPRLGRQMNNRGRVGLRTIASLRRDRRCPFARTEKSKMT